MTQAEKVMAYISEHQSISSWEAFRDLGITRLAARIADLERDGVHFNRKREAVKNRYGEQTYYIRYSLAEREQNNG